MVLCGVEVVTVMSIPFVSECDVDVADGSGDADLHVLRFGVRHRARDQVLHHTAGLAAGAAVADTHSTSAIWCEARGLGLLEQWPAIVNRFDATVGEYDSSAGCL